MTNYHNGFVCLECGAQHPADYDGYLCEKCGGNLDATYDYTGVKSELSVEKLRSNDRRDVWRYAPLYPIESLDKIPPLDMGMTPLYANEEIEEEVGGGVFLKDDTRLPSASFKDRASSVVMTVAREKGIDKVACASTGNAGCSWACMGASCGMPVIIFVPASAPQAKIAQLEVYGADVRQVDGTYDEAFELCVDVCEEEGYFNRNTGFNPFTREGKKSVAFEIWEQFDYSAPGSVFVPVGDGNIISGVWKGFRDLKELGLINKLPQIISVQSSQSAAVNRTVESIRASGSQPAPDEIEMKTVSANTRADSIAVDAPSDGIAAVRAVLETDGEAVTVDDEEILDNIGALASTSGIFAEPAGVTSVAGLRSLAGSAKLDNIKFPAVCLLTGNGLKDVEAVLER
ncbi:MAG: threonine synthase [bacterium]